MKLQYMYILLLFSRLLYAQTFEISTFRWGEKEITWDDFKGTVTNYSSSSEFSYTIGYQNYTRDVNDLEITWLETYTLFNRNNSWVNPRYKNDTLLYYYKVAFNIAELYSRKAQNEINKLKGSFGDISSAISDILPEYNSRCRQRLTQMRSETKEGTDYNAIKDYDALINIELERNPRITIPDYTTGKLTFGSGFHIGYGRLGGKASGLFTDGGIFGFDLQFGYIPFTLFLNGSAVYMKAKQDVNLENSIWRNGEPGDFYFIELSGGLPVYQSRRIDLLPFIGAAYTGFSQNKNTGGKNITVGQASVILGLNLDVNLSRSINFINYFLFRGIDIWAIRARLTAVPFNFSSSLKGWSYNFTVGLAILKRVIEQ